MTRVGRTTNVRSVTLLGSQHFSRPVVGVFSRSRDFFFHSLKELQLWIRLRPDDHLSASEDGDIFPRRLVRNDSIPNLSALSEVLSSCDAIDPALSDGAEMIAFQFDCRERLSTIRQMRNRRVSASCIRECYNATGGKQADDSGQQKCHHVITQPGTDAPRERRRQGRTDLVAGEDPAEHHPHAGPTECLGGQPYGRWDGGDPVQTVEDGKRGQSPFRSIECLRQPQE